MNVNGTSTRPHAGTPPPAFYEAFLVWTKIGLLSFGGPAGQIALMHRVLVDEKQWVDESRFLHALNYCMLLPGPEAQQLATYIGWLLHGVRGGLAAGLLFIVPGAVVILGLSYGYVLFAGAPLLEVLFLGIKAAVLVIVIQALARIAGRVLRNGAMKALALGAFLAIFVGNAPFPLIVLTAGIIGLLRIHSGDARFDLTHGDNVDNESTSIVTTPPSVLRTATVAAGGVVLWAAPIVICALTLGTQHVLVLEGAFFSKLAVVTFGGAYAVLAYMAQQAVEVYAWLSPGEMLDGLGLAESTPGPLIMVTQFVGFLGAYRNPAPFEPNVAALIGSAMTVWVTFVPCFLWILLGAPYVESMRHSRYASAALTAVSAAVVGVIANLSVWFGINVLFNDVTTVTNGWFRLLVPEPGSLNVTALLLTSVATLTLFRLRLGVLTTLLICSTLAALGHLLMGYL